MVEPLPSKHEAEFKPQYKKKKKLKKKIKKICLQNLFSYHTELHPWEAMIMIYGFDVNLLFFLQLTLDKGVRECGLTPA
jgi:hypothetical protein